MTTATSSLDRATDHEPAGSGPCRRPRRLLAAALVVAVIVGMWRVADGSSGSAAPEPLPVRTSTATVEERTLRRTLTEEGTLGYGSTAVITTQFGGVITTIADSGTVVDRGGALFAVDRRPVVLLFGQLPAYRQLWVGVDGPDVGQLEANLVALGHADVSSMTVDEKYTAATAAAVRRWQASLGQEQTGAVDFGAVVFLPQAVRVGTHEIQVGSSVQPTMEVTEVASNTKVVTVQLDARGTSSVQAGGKADLGLPDGARTTGNIASVGAVATKADEDSDPKVDVQITLDDPSLTGDLDQAPVDVEVEVDSTEALAVPVTALVALREGGYAVQLAGGTTARFVRVELGVFADGYVEVRSDELRAGMKVVMPR